MMDAKGRGQRWRCAALLGVAVAGMGSVWGQAHGVACDAALAGRSGACTELASEIAKLLDDPAVARAHWGIAVAGMEVASGDGAGYGAMNAPNSAPNSVPGNGVIQGLIYGLNEGQLFQPASNNKLFTTAAVMALLPSSHVFRTTVTGEGLFLNDGTLRGDLTLHGVGDANLSGRDLPYLASSLRPQPVPPENDPLRYLEEMADQVKAAGVKRVEGDVIGSDVLFPWEPYPQDWAIDDAMWEYGAPVSGLTVADNKLRLTVAPGDAPGSGEVVSSAVVTLEQAVPYYEVRATVVTVPAGRPAVIAIERSMGSRVVRVSGSIAANAKPDIEEIAMEDPAEYAAMAMKQMLEDRGIMVTGVAKAEHAAETPSPGFARETGEPIANLVAVPDGQDWAKAAVAACAGCDPRWASRTLAAHVSPPLVEDVVVTNKVSQNLHAELMLRQLGLAIVGNGNTAQGVRVVRAFLTTKVGVDKDDFFSYDGSGLSGHDLVTPRATVQLLQYAAMQPWFAEWKNSLPVGGVDGSLEGRFTKAPLKGRVFAKTGTLGEARALSGYVECASGRTVIFSIMVGNHAPQNNADREVMDKIVAAIAAAN
jgi:D-alanyl-D-alanine carboxypeptidase/D-alanyl-D-alanine-endopeptidase (penicillin-binding protein 4)